MNPWLARLAHKVYYRLQGVQAEAVLRRLEGEQWLAPGEIRRLQVRRLPDLLLHARRNVPFYRERFARAGFDPERFDDPAELRRLPLLTKEDIRAAGDSILSRVHRKQDLLPYDSGGSTGVPVTIYRAHDDQELSGATLRRQYRWYGFDVGDRLTMLWGALRDEMPASTLAQRIRAAFANQQFLNAYDLTPERMREYADRILRFRPRVIKGYVNPLVVFSRFLLRHGIDAIRPHVVLTGAEGLYEPQREIIARAFGCPVRNTYGGREPGLMAAECPEHGQMHLFEETVYFEFLHEGEPVGAGQPGEVVITDLKKRAMPLIRYRVEDVAVPSGRSCPCGRGLATLSRIAGRSQDIIRTRRGHFVAGELFIHVFIDQPIERFQAHQQNLDSVLIRMVPAPGFHAGVTEEVERRLRGFVGDELTIRFETVPSIDLTRTGKRRYVISDLPADGGP